MKFQFSKIKNNTLAGVLVHLGLAVGLFLLLAIFYFYAYLPSSTNHGETITVPDIEGQTLEQIEAVLEKKSLRYEISDSTYSEDYPPLTVIKQYPHPGAKVKEGRKIFVSVNRVNPPSVPVPNLIDGSVVNADAVLRSNQLKRGKIELIAGEFNVVAEMKFKGQKIEPHTRVPKGSVIDLVVMDGGGGEKMPNLSNYTFEDAEFVILGFSAVVGKITLSGDTLGNKPVVIKQIPAPHENIHPGDSVHLWIGPDTRSEDAETH
jgi:eukaryotic-like serine/threonine-protein kinase